MLARRHRTTVDEVPTRELEDVACAHAEELAAGDSGIRGGARVAGGLGRARVNGAAANRPK